MKNIIYLFFVFVFFACKNEEPPIQFETVNFVMKVNDWDSEPYKFKSDIEEKVIPEMGNQYASWDYSYIGEYQKTLSMWDGETGGRKPLTEEEAARFEKFKPTDAIQHILKEAENYQVTIINEAHQMPPHRVFTTSLLEGMYERGYRYLGMETLMSNIKADSTLNAQKYPTFKSGFYSKEPQFGNLIRTALKMGFQLFSYESAGHGNPKDREIGQARNIEAFLKNKSEGKVLIHCGFAHAAEGVYGGRWEKTMAGRLTEFTEIDPLTIDQTNFSEKSDKKYEAGFFKNLDLEKPTVFVDDAGKSFKTVGKTYGMDIYVFHPRTKNFDRPEWLQSNGKQEYSLSLSEIDMECTCRVMAYRADEPMEETIPVDVLEREKDEVAKLMLEKGNYNIIVTNKEGIFQKAKIEVKE